ncbi:peptidoglycan/LPS O-acetylase OafA/YrhL [Pseudoduganella flava]|uniref:Acyltransferase family protein n=1 Tax=Pseudoduganella flava TaxID=871742 RepID=A0A562PW39_9BURK|nr:acyltransferase [Pseudoduganella flava]QGZ39716.1 acyltransferase family protein [Pseudoduganella flava]TWI48627.1 peptidoglycan/LPS O-acetylase OafA/YrhL [Pseudoduganella flava]
MRFAYLDGMRGIAAMFILVRHWHGLLGLDFYFSHLAVDLFFILSGFVIAHGYDARLRDASLPPHSFMLLRLVRIYPVFTLSVIVSVASRLAGALSKGNVGHVPDVLVAGAASLFLIPVPLPDSPSLFPLNVCYWSLLLELIVNAGYAAFHPMLRTRVLAAIVGTCALVLVALGTAEGTIGFGFSYSLFSVGVGFVRAVFGIALGVLLYRERARWLALARQVPAPVGIGLVVAVLAMPHVPGYGHVEELVAVFVVLPMAVAIAATAEPSGWRLRLMCALGAASYPLYLLHVPIARVVRNGVALVPGWERPLAFLAALLLVLACVYIERHVDIPLRSQLRKWLAGATAARARA